MKAAKLLRQGVPWEQVYPAIIPGFSNLSKGNQDMHAANLRRNVNRHLKKTGVRSPVRPGRPRKPAQPTSIAPANKGVYLRQRSWQSQNVVKRKTSDQIQAMQAKAVRFLRDVVGDPGKADEFEARSPEEYAEHKGIEIVERNPTATTLTTTRRGNNMPTKQELEDRISELEGENEDLQDRLDQIADLTSSEAEEEDDDEDGAEGEDDSPEEDDPDDDLD